MWEYTRSDPTTRSRAEGCFHSLDVTVVAPAQAAHFDISGRRPRGSSIRFAALISSANGSRETAICHVARHVPGCVELQERQGLRHVRDAHPHPLPRPRPSQIPTAPHPAPSSNTRSGAPAAPAVPAAAGALGSPSATQPSKNAARAHDDGQSSVCPAVPKLAPGRVSDS